MAKVKLIPYGISDFLQVRRENKYFSDKSMFLERMELTGNFLFMTRPRRFGKSIFLSMLRAYYDINERDNFDANFSGLYIHDHPTPGMGMFQVLYLDFSLIGGDSKSAEARFEAYGCDRLDDFASQYARFYYDGFTHEVGSRKTFAAKLNWIAAKARAAGNQLYLVIDEYDNFTNNILNQEGQRVYRDLTHATGFYRDVFKLFKPTFTRILMMGVLPVTMDDLTSGFNIATNISLRSKFNTMLGFSEKEVRQMIEYYIGAGMLHADEEDIIDDMRPWYDNYCFAEESLGSDPKMFNSDMVCYYLNYYIQEGHAPKDHLDPNTKTDYKKLKNIVRIETLDSRRLDIIHTIAGQGFIMGNVNASFPAERIADENNFISLLYYYGMLTIVGSYGAMLKLGIPNNNVRLQYYDYLLEEYERIAHVDMSALNMAYAAAALDGDWRPMIETITDDYRDNASVRSLIEGERNLQGFMMAFLSKNPYYLVAPELEMSHGYCDFFFLPDHRRYPEVRHSYIIELKYLKADATEAQADKQWQEAVAQIRRYAGDKTVRRLLDGTKLHLLVVQIKGYERQREEEITL